MRDFHKEVTFKAIFYLHQQFMFLCVNCLTICLFFLLFFFVCVCVCVGGGGGGGGGGEGVTWSRAFCSL